MAMNKIKEKASECELQSSNTIPRSQNTQPNIHCGPGTGGRASIRRPSDPMVNGTFPSGSGADAKYLMLAWAPNDNVPQVAKTATVQTIHPMGNSKKGSRALRYEDDQPEL
mmetsp:Transcript_85218/g.264796  ORF Transcript_85218/g.264796 Transcript_85218/m.264796 type:complete len:111 (+) Transcript_85218:410-742(+)